MRSKAPSSLTLIFLSAIGMSGPARAAELFQHFFVPSGPFTLPHDQAPLTPPATDASAAAAIGDESTQGGDGESGPQPGEGGSAASGIAWPMNDKAYKALNVDQRRAIWRDISEVRKERERPTTRGPWYTLDTRRDRVARAASDSQYAFIVTQGMAMMQPGRGGQDDAERGAKAVIATGAATVLLKKTMRRRRPYPNDHKFGSFPSGHTSTVFAMATVFSSAQPQQRLMALGAAGLVGWSRVKVRAHHWDDVLIGGSLGYIIGRHFAPDNPAPQRQNFPVASVRFTF
jgi:hypothetical protein